MGSLSVGGALRGSMPDSTHHHSPDAKPKDHQHHARGHYVRLGLMALLSFVAMYILMYAMVAMPGDIHPNLNQAYMAALMAAPMVLIELALMGGMYPNKRLNAAIAAGSAIIFVGAFFFIRQQTAIGDTEFLRSMIPH